MELFKHRSFTIACCAFFASLIICYYAGTTARLAFLCIIFSFCIFCIGFYYILRKQCFKRIFIKCFPACLFIALAILISFLVFDKAKEMRYLCDNAEHTVTFKVDKAEVTTSFGSRYSACITSVDGKNKEFTTSIYDESAVFEENDIVCATVKFTAAHSLRLEDSRGIDFGADTVKIISIEKGSKDSVDYLRDVNRFLDGIFRQELNDDAYALISAMFLGNRDKLSADVERDFTRVGLVHILSLSGMHISIFITIISFFVFSLKMRKGFKLILMILTVFAFIAVTGFQPSALRSGLMQLAFFSLYFLWERADTINSLFASVLIICLLNPYLIFSLSLLLSFLAMLGCICASYFLRRNEGNFKVKTAFGRFFFLTLISTELVTAITFPIIALKFGAFSTLSFISNLLIAPVLNLLIYLSPLLLAASPIPFVSDAIAFVCEIITLASEWCCSRAAGLSWGYLPISTPLQYIAVLLLFLGILIFIIMSKKQIRVALFALICGVSLLITSYVISYTSKSANDYVSISSNYDSDTVFIESNNSLTAIDTSKHSLGYLYQMSSISQLGYTELENYISCDYSYYSADYIDLLTDTIIVRNVYLPKPSDNELEYHDKITKMLLQKGVRVKYIEPELYIDGAVITFSQSTYIERSTKRAVAYSVLINNSRITYLGASSFEALDYFALDYVKASDVVIFGSYGPSYAMEYDYDCENVKHIIFLGNSKDYAATSLLYASEGKESPRFTKFTIK